MGRSTIALVTALFGLFSARFAVAQPVLTDSNLTLETVASGLSVPTTMAFLAPNDMLVLQKNNGQVRRVTNGVVQAAPVLDLAVSNNSERGLLGIAINSQNPPRVFLYFTAAAADAGTATANRIVRYDWNPAGGGSLVNPVSIRDLPVATGPNHDGGILVLGPPETGLAEDGRPLYAVIGDLNFNGQLQNNSGGAAPDDRGVIFRLQQDAGGTPHPGNPFFPYCSVTTVTTCEDAVDCPAGESCITKVASYYAYGVRNSFGLALDPATGKLWDTENGPNLYDEVNLVEPGFNSGWNKIMGPDSRDPEGLADLFNMPGANDSYSDPEFSWLTPIAPTAIVFPWGSALPAAYQNVALVGDNNNGQLYSFPLNAGRSGFALVGALTDLVADSAAERDQQRIGSGFGAITDLKIGPDGALYVVSISQGAIYRIRATNSTPTPNPTATSTPTRTPTFTPTPTTIPTSTPTRTPTTAPPPTATPVPAAMHVGDLDRTASMQNPRWRATVTIAVHDAAHVAVSGALVSGAWSGGASGSGSCTTAADGRCSVTSPLIHKKTASATWTVNGVSAAGKVYQPGANHDPDGDGNGTVISVPRP